MFDKKSYNRKASKKRYETRKRLNLCIQCGNPAIGKRKKPLCQKCIDKIRDAVARRKAERLEKGLCQSCGKNKIKAKKHKFCTTCKEKLSLNTYKTVRKNWKSYIWLSVRTNAAKRNIEFTITKEDIPDMPAICPLLEIPLEMGKGHVMPNSPSIDRIDSSKGYVPGNIWIISAKANTMKSNATLKEIELLAKNLNQALRKKSGNS